MQWGEKGRARMGRPMIFGVRKYLDVSSSTGARRRPAQQRLVRLALASLGSGPNRPLLRILKSGSGTLGIWDGQHEAHFARRTGAERFASHGSTGTTVSLI